jgi:integrase
MAIRMPHPTRHPKSGVYAARVAIPKHLRAIVARQHGRTAVEFRENLGTRDKVEAVRRSRAVFERFDGWLRAAEAELKGIHDRLTDHDISVLCGRWLAAKEAESRDDMVLSGEQHEEARDHLSDLIGDDEHGSGVAPHVVARDLDADITPLLADAGRNVDPASRHKLAMRLARVAFEWHRGQVERAATGRWRPTVSAQEFPSGLLSAAGAVTFDIILVGWAGDRGWKLDMKPIPRPLYDRVRTIERLATFVGHRDAKRVTKADAVRWKEEMQARGVSAATIRNDISEMSAIWKVAISNGRLETNPFAGVSPPKPKTRTRKVRAFTDEEAKRVLEAARKETGALRWLPWVCCLTGARVGEIVQSAKEDVVTVQGVRALRIHDEELGRSLKNEDSRRTVPIHPALQDEGFLDYVAALPKGSPLFPDIGPDKQFNSRAVTATKRVQRWIRGGVGITDPSISPNHSWRHWFVQAARAVVMPTEIRSAITGHSGKVDESACYGEGMRALVVVMAEHLERVAPPSLNG